MKTNRGELFVSIDNINKQIPEMKTRLMRLNQAEKNLEDSTISNSICEISMTRLVKQSDSKIKLFVQIINQDSCIEIDLEEENLNKTFTM